MIRKVEHRIALVTCEAYPGLNPDDQLLRRAFQLAGHEVDAVDWARPNVDWKSFDAVIMRSTWDYYLRLPEFMAWLDKLHNDSVQVFNPLPMIRENIDKRYLQTLALKGVEIVPTVFASKDDRMSLDKYLTKMKWDEVVVKPTISAGSFQTWRSNAATAIQHSKQFEDLLLRSEVMIQPFLRAIEVEGEYSLMYFGKEYSHTVLKQAKSGDFRVQDKFGGTIEAVTPSAEMLAAGEKVLNVLRGEPLYARVDLVMDKGRPLLGEIELIEPHLYFGYDKKAAEKFVEIYEKLAK